MKESRIREKEIYVDSLLRGNNEYEQYKLEIPADTPTSLYSTLLNFESEINNLEMQKQQDDQDLNTIRPLFSSFSIIEKSQKGNQRGIHNQDFSQNIQFNIECQNLVNKLREVRKSNQKRNKLFQDVQLLGYFQNQMEIPSNESNSDLIDHNTLISDYEKVVGHIEDDTADFYAQKRDILEMIKVLIQNLVESRKSEIVSSKIQ